MTLQSKKTINCFILLSKIFLNLTYIISQKMKFSIKDFFSKCDQIYKKLRIWSHLLKKSSMENFIFCAVYNLPRNNKVWKFKSNYITYSYSVGYDSTFCGVLQAMTMSMSSETLNLVIIGGKTITTTRTQRCATFVEDSYNI